MKLKKPWTVMMVGILALAPLSFAKDADKAKAEQDRLRNADTVLKEILKVPDNIPQELLDKARCVIVMPSVLKAAFVVGGSYGRGTMVCRTGHDFSGPWGAPAMYALEGGSIGLQIGGEATDFVLLVMNDRGADSLAQQGEAWRGCVGRGGTSRTHCGGGYGRLYAIRDSELLTGTRGVRGNLPRRLNATP